VNQKSDGNELKRNDKKKLGKIAAVGDAAEVFENIVKKEKVKSPFDYQLILNAFNQHFIFNQIQPVDKYDMPISNG
jgi:cGMP-dependent protein kinase